jgi:hypothetical protein
MATASKKSRSSGSIKQKKKSHAHDKAHGNAPALPRIRKQAKHKSFRLSKNVKLKRPALPGAYALLKLTFQLIFHNKKLFFGIVFINVFLGFIFVQSFGSSTNFADLKAQVENLLGDSADRFGTSLAIFNYAIGSLASSTSEIAGTYQIFLTLLSSVAVIWAIREVSAGEEVTARDAFYRGLYPLAGFILVLFAIGLQMLPLMLGNLLYGTVFGNGLAVTAPEKVLWLLLFGLLALFSLYMLLSSVFALYIVTLPDMTPLKALRSARQLVLHRRTSVFLRIIVLPIALVTLAALIMVPIILFASGLAQIVFSIITMLGLVFVHGYLYSLYRALL